MRQNRIAWAVGCVLLLVSGCGKAGKAEFKEFASAEGRFKVKMPGTPKEEMHFAGLVSMKVYSVQEENGAYAVAFADMPISMPESAAQVQARLDGARDGMVKKANATLTSAHSISLRGTHPGREVNADLPAQKGKLRARVYLVDKRLYQVMVVGTKSWTTSSDATKFLDSLVVTP